MHICSCNYGVQLGRKPTAPCMAIIRRTRVRAQGIFSGSIPAMASPPALRAAGPACTAGRTARGRRAVSKVRRISCAMHAAPLTPASDKLYSFSHAALEHPLQLHSPQHHYKYAIKIIPPAKNVRTSAAECEEMGPGRTLARRHARQGSRPCHPAVHAVVPWNDTACTARPHSACSTPASGGGATDSSK